MHDNFYTSNIRYYMYNYIHLCVDGACISDFVLGPRKVRNSPACNFHLKGRGCEYFL
jgi:hypothetical protein